MLTPVFELSQDDDFVLVLIRTPYIKVEFDYFCAEFDILNSVFTVVGL